MYPVDSTEAGVEIAVDTLVIGVRLVRDSTKACLGYNHQ